jgi:hypothetical protein
MRRAGAIVACAALWGCSEPRPEPLCTSSGATRASLVTHATFAKNVDDAAKHVEGLDVDGVVSDENDATGCYKPDFVGPDGTPGIDNQIATLWPIVEQQVGKDNIDTILNAAILNGQLIILMSVRGVDDPVNDDCVDVAFGAGTGLPQLDTSGKVVANQTFGWNLDVDPVSVVPRGRIENGMLLAGPGEIVVPVRILDAKFSLKLHSTRVRMKVTTDPLTGGATLAGYVGGGIAVDDLAEIIKGLNIGASVMGAIVPLLASRADLGADAEGTCHQVSAALKFETTPAFVMGER